MEPLRSLIVPTDFSPLSEAAAARAATLARATGATVHLLHALRFPLIANEYEVSVPKAAWEGVRRAAEQRLEAARVALASAGVGASAELAESRDPVAAIAGAVASRNADLVVMGTHGRGGLRRAFLGSVAERALRTLHRPVLAVKEEAAEAARPIARILVAVDFSVHADRAVDVAAALAAQLGASLDVLHVLVPPRAFMPYVHAAAFGTGLEDRMREEATTRLEAVRERLAGRGIAAETHHRHGTPSTAISEAAETLGAQVVALGTRGQSGLAHVLLGSVAERTLREAPCSVLAVPPEADDAG